MDAVVCADEVGRGRPLRAGGLGTWLGLTLVLVLCLNTLGGWVRLSGSGLAIPQWPILTREDGSRTLLPPMGVGEWAAAFAQFQEDQGRLRDLVRQGVLSVHDLGRQPATLSEYQGMYWTEWCHRLLAGLVGAWLVAVTALLWRDPAQRRSAWLMTVAVGFTGVQAVLGGMLVHHGTGTRWLFLHQANAGVIVGLLVWALLAQLRAGDGVASAQVRRLPWIGWTAAVLLGAIWLQLIAGAWLAASRDGVQAGMAQAVWRWPWDLWDAASGVGGNLLDNHAWHLWLHAWIVVAIVGILAWLLLLVRRGSPERLRLAVWVAATFVGVQALLGLMSVTAADAYVSLAHQFAGMCLFCAATIACHDAWNAAEAA